MIGQRGLPATSGGIERHVEEIGARLVDLGHEVVVYCRPTYSPLGYENYRGMTLRYVPTAHSKHFETIVHSAAATVAAMRDRVDIIHYHALGPGLLTPVPRCLSGAKVVQTVHGLDNERVKWGRIASRVLDFGCWSSARVPDATVVVSHALAGHYHEKYGRQTRYVCNGVEDLPWQPPAVALRALGVEPGKYVLFVGRLVPEKAPDLLIRAFRRIERPDLRLLVVGGSSFTDRYVHDLERLAAADSRVILAGRIHARPFLRELYASAGAFVLPSELEGMPLTLLEAAAEGTPLLASDIPAHIEMIGPDRPGRRLFRRGDAAHLRRALLDVIDNVPVEQEGSAAERAAVLKEYSWDRAADELSRLYRSLTDGRPRREPRVHRRELGRTSGLTTREQVAAQRA